MAGVSVDLADRYGTRRKRRPVALSIVVIVAAVLIGWLLWAASGYFSPEARSDVVGWKVVDQHTTVVTANVSLKDGVDNPLCRVRVLAADHSAVGELQFTPGDGINEVTVTTEREADSVDWVGCTTEDQRRPQ